MRLVILRVKCSTHLAMFSEELLLLMTLLYAGFFSLVKLRDLRVLSQESMPATCKLMHKVATLPWRLVFHVRMQLQQHATAWNSPAQFQERCDSLALLWIAGHSLKQGSKQDLPSRTRKSSVGPVKLRASLAQTPTLSQGRAQAVHMMLQRRFNHLARSLSDPCRLFPISLQAPLRAVDVLCLGAKEPLIVMQFPVNSSMVTPIITNQIHALLNSDTEGSVRSEAQKIKFRPVSRAVCSFFSGNASAQASCCSSSRVLTLSDSELPRTSFG